jgi:phage/plasmid-associated DNA primase
VFCLGELYVFDDETGLWNSNENIQFKIIGRFEEHLHLLREGKDGRMIKSPKSYGNTTVLKRQLIPELKTLNINDEWLKQSQSSSLGKILFNNGYLDMKTGDFHETFDPNIVFFYKINQDWEQFYDDDLEYMRSVERRMFLDPLGADVGDYLILNLARGFAGDVMKRIIFGLGGTDCGKSVLTKAIACALGGYAGSFNAENLAYSKSSADEAAQMRWVMLLRYKRIIFSNEMKSTVELNGNMIKKISSGGDSVIARSHCKEEEEFCPHFLPMCMSNDLNKITPYDDAVSNRIRVVSFKKRFVEVPRNDWELPMDRNIEKEIETPKFKRAFVGMLVRRYIKFMKEENGTENEPKGVLEAKTEWIGGDAEVGFVSKFLEDYEITNEEHHFIPSTEIDSWAERKKLGISMRKFGVELKKYCTIQGFDKVNNIVKKINKKNARVWVGIRRLEIIMDEETSQEP